jgi:hypothetical protein
VQLRFANFRSPSTPVRPRVDADDPAAGQTICGRKARTSTDSPPFRASVRAPPSPEGLNGWLFQTASVRYGLFEGVHRWGDRAISAPRRTQVVMTQHGASRGGLWSSSYVAVAATASATVSARLNRPPCRAGRSPASLLCGSDQELGETKVDFIRQIDRDKLPRPGDQAEVQTELLGWFNAERQIN